MFAYTQTHVLHHFLHRRKLSGKCSKCDKGFGSWKKFSGRVSFGFILSPLLFLSSPLPLTLFFLPPSTLSFPTLPPLSLPLPLPLPPLDPSSSSFAFLFPYYPPSPSPTMILTTLSLSSTQEIVGYSCSWCGDSYHPACFNQQLKKEACHFGPLRNLIIPPSWIVRTPAIEPVS